MDHKVVGSMVFFTQEQLDDSPSRRDGMSADEERALRRAAHQIIFDVCQAMGVHAQYAYVAVYLCLRYYAVRSWRRSDRWLIMPAALSLALKVREAPKPIAHVIAEFEKRRWRDYERARPGEPRRAYDKAYIDGLKEPFCVAERAILFATGFQFGVGDPYPHVAKQLHALGLRDEPGAPRARSAKTEVQQMAFCFLRDSLATTLCLRFAPEKIAAVAVYLALQVYRRPVALTAAAPAAAPAAAAGGGGGDELEEGEAREDGGGGGGGAGADAEPLTFCEVCNILPEEIIEVGNEITATYIAALRAAPGPVPSGAPAPPGRRPVAMPPQLGSAVVDGDRWVITASSGARGSGGGGPGHKPSVSGGGGGGNGAFAALP